MKILNILIFLLIFNTFILFGYLSSTITGKMVYDKIMGNVTYIVDGDTIDVEIGQTIQRVRLLGINTPEKKMPFYSEAKNFTMQILGKEVEIETAGKDKYDRTLAYIFIDGNENFNSEILRRGLASLYVYEKDNYYSELEKAEKYARDNEIGLWEKSVNSGCMKLVKLDYIEQERCNNQELLILENNCDNMSIILKDDANHIEKLEIEKGNFTKNYSCVWNDAGDSLYIRDNSGLILFYRY